MDNRTLAREIVEQSAVLLKNEGFTLPLASGQRIALFGRTQLCTVFSGSGSGAAHTQQRQTFLEECERAGLVAEPELKAFYARAVNAEEPPQELDADTIRSAVNCGLMYEIFGKYHAPVPEYEIPSEMFSTARAFTDTAILILGRDAGGEECDRHLEEDYYLTASEQVLVRQVCERFHSVVLVLNTNGLIDLAWTETYPTIRSILFLGVCGEEGPAALANLLVGKSSPSGKLAVTIARRYEDYPSAKHFSWDKDHPENLLTYENYGLDSVANGSVGFIKSPVTVYQEDIYLGYRYFDTFGKKPLYSFGVGLSYTTFSLFLSGVASRPDGIAVTVHVQNTGNMTGREVVQLYLSARSTASERPLRELKGFEKTELLEPGDNTQAEIFLPWHELACYNEKKAAWVIEAGRYEMSFGASPEALSLATAVDVPHDLTVQQCKNRLGLQVCNLGKLDFLHHTASPVYAENAAPVMLALDTLPAKPVAVAPQLPVLQDFAVEQLAALCVGYGPGIPFSAFSDNAFPSTIKGADGTPLTICDHPTGFPGYVSPAIPDKDIHSAFYKDGPSSVGGVAWPTEMLLACSFDRKLWRAFGDAIGGECEEQQVDVWLSPAVNLHRHPLCGRNFEYLSEDPYLTGVCACEITRGVQENHPVMVCPKHFAVNEQETFRRGSAKWNYDAVDSILTERAARELYLKPFQMLVQEAGISCIMTSFNKINGIFAGGNTDLCTHILRDEWDFDGVVVTDWGDMDMVVDGADAVAAGNDVIMPGGPPVIDQILTGYTEGRVTRAQLENAVGHLLRMLERKQKHKREAVT